MRKALMCALLGLTLIAGAAPKFQVGERVDSDIPGGGSGTVLEVGHGVPYEGYYKVHFDKLHHYDAKEGMWVNPKEHSLNHLGADGQPVAEPQTTAQPQAPAATTQTQANPPQATTPQVQARPGSQEANFMELIRQRYHAEKGVRLEVVFHTFQVDSQVPYEHVYSSDTRGHVYNAWPVKATYTVIEHYPTQDMLHDYDAKYFCFKDVHGEWLAVQRGETKMSTGRYINH